MIRIQIPAPANPALVEVSVDDYPIGLLKSIRIDESGVFVAFPEDDFGEPEIRRAKVQMLEADGGRISPI